MLPVPKATVQLLICAFNFVSITLHSWEVLYKGGVVWDLEVAVFDEWLECGGGLL